MASEVTVFQEKKSIGLCDDWKNGETNKSENEQKPVCVHTYMHVCTRAIRIDCRASIFACHLSRFIICDESKTDY